MRVGVVSQSRASSLSPRLRLSTLASSRYSPETASCEGARRRDCRLPETASDSSGAQPQMIARPHRASPGSRAARPCRAGARIATRHCCIGLEHRLSCQHSNLPDTDPAGPCSGCHSSCCGRPCAIVSQGAWVSACEAWPAPSVMSREGWAEREREPTWACSGEEARLRRSALRASSTGFKTPATLFGRPSCATLLYPVTRSTALRPCCVHLSSRSIASSSTTVTSASIHLCSKDALLLRHCDGVACHPFLCHARAHLRPRFQPRQA